MIYSSLQEIEQQGLVFLSSFTAVFQLIAGVFLSIMFEKILENSPINSLIDILDQKYINRVMKFHAYFYNDKRFKELLINYNTNNKNYSIFPRIKNIACITCIYCCFILVVTGFGTYYQNRAEFVPNVFLILSSIAVIFYDLLTCHTNIKYFSLKSTAAVYFTIIVILYGTIFLHLEQSIVDWLCGKNCSFANLWLLVLCTPFFSIYSIVVLIYINCIRQMYRIRELSKFSHNLDELYDALFAEDPLQNLPKRHRNEFMERLYNEISQKKETDTINVRGILRNYIKDEAQKKCNEIIEKIRQDIK